VTPPHDFTDERALLGAAIVHPDIVGELVTVVRPGDFYRPAHSAIFTALEALHADGRAWDDRALAVEARRLGGEFETAELSAMQAHPTFAWRRTAERLVELRARRDLLAVAEVIEKRAVDTGQYPSDTLTEAKVALDAVDLVTDALPDTLLLSAMVATMDHEAAPWVIPGLLRAMWRAMVVGLEGHGKSLLLAQVGWCASQGLHPFTRRHCEPVMVLHVDLENTIDRVGEGYKPLHEATKAASRCYDDGRHYTWHRPDGIDVRARRDRAQLECILRDVQPGLVCIGPLRKSYQPRPGENDERASLGVQAVFDDLRARFGFALLIEHHAPHADAGGTRRRPFGSSTWLGWPEFGLTMDAKKENPTQYRLGRWRGDRVKAAWPDEIHHSGLGSDWYWDGHWSNPDVLRAVS
jgi:replicative DNA helicase